MYVVYSFEISLAAGLFGARHAIEYAVCCMDNQ